MAELDDWQEELGALVQQARFLTENLTDAQFNWHPSPDRWSIAQCLDHLNKVNLLLLPRMESEISDALPLAPDAFRVWHPSFLERLFIQTVGPNARYKAEVPKLYIPAPEGTVKDVMHTFCEANDRILACMEQAKGHDLRRIKVTSPVSGLVRMSLGAWFASAVVHTEYHIGQAKAVKAEPGFPSP
ncbi:MAG TPA: DinB family protein [Chthonomonadaceae bacterium]|nr:DinB family protein [Chthonomonadaceae bacterium]